MHFSTLIIDHRSRPLDHRDQANFNLYDPRAQSLHLEFETRCCSQTARRGTGWGPRNSPKGKADIALEGFIDIDVYYCVGQNSIFLSK